MINVLKNDPSTRSLDEKRLTEIAEFTLDFLKMEHTEVTIVFVSTSEMKSLNKKYREFDSSTDVLSFKMDIMNEDTGLKYLGDVIISWENAYEQAKQNEIDDIEEIQNLIIHGILHLVGYNDEIPSERDKMMKLQKSIFKKFILEQ